MPALILNGVQVITSVGYSEEDMNYFEATQSAYTRTPVRLPEWGDGKYVFWGAVTVKTINTDENGIESHANEEYTGLCLEDGVEVNPYVPTESESSSDEWVEL